MNATSATSAGAGADTDTTGATGTKKSGVSAVVLPRVMPRRIPWARLQLLGPLISPLLLLAMWTWVTREHWFPEQILVPPNTVVDAFRDVWSSGELPDDLRISLYRLLLGFALGATTGVVLGVVLATSRQAQIYLGPTFYALRQVPTLALIPMFILLFGIGETLKIVIVVKSATFPVAIATLDGVRNIPRQYLEVGRALRLGPWAQFRRVLFPATVPPILTGVRVALGRCWMVLVAVELLAADTGIGEMMENGMQTLRLDVVMVGVIVTGVIGFALDRGLRQLERGLLPWRYR